jgi:hypothetical protein
MCDWGGGPNEVGNYVRPDIKEQHPTQDEIKDRGWGVDSDDYVYIGRAETSLIDHGTLIWMCRRDGTVVAHQGMHERSFHPGA